MSTEPPHHTPEDVQRDVDALFHQWEEEQAHVDLSDLRPQDSLVFAIFWGLFGVVLLQFYTRYVLNASLGWTEEIARYLLIMVTFIGSITAMRKGTHISVEALLIYMPPRVRHWLLVIIDALVALFCGAMAYYGWVLGNRAPGYMVSVDIPKAWMYWAVAGALAGITYHAIVRFVRRLRDRQPDHPYGAAID
ncbi:MAG TPA: TRAP transporter small permease [Beijerinckiaceae bacterium]|nr:TRAP transporter small permease [Beijerinckiaceae bacterium]